MFKVEKCSSMPQPFWSFFRILFRMPFWMLFRRLLCVLSTCVALRRKFVERRNVWRPMLTPGLQFPTLSFLWPSAARFEDIVELWQLLVSYVDSAQQTINWTPVSAFHLNNRASWRVGERDTDDLYSLLVDIRKTSRVFFVFHITRSCWRLWVRVSVLFALWGSAILDPSSSGVCRGFECWREFLRSRVSGFIEFSENGGYLGRIDPASRRRRAAIIRDRWASRVPRRSVWAAALHRLLWKLHSGPSADGHWLDDRIVRMLGRCPQLRVHYVLPLPCVWASRRASRRREYLVYYGSGCLVRDSAVNVLWLCVLVLVPQKAEAQV